jgi:hypothetical protein
MATIDQVQERYQIKAEKNGTNDDIATDRGRFCINFNESQNKFLTIHLQNRGIDDVRYIQKFLTLNHKIPYTSTPKDPTLWDFELPKNYFDLSDVTATAIKGGCTTNISLVELQTENLNEILQDEFSKPSFEWQEALYTVNSDKISIYTTDFKIEELSLNYYRYPNQIKLVDETNPESDFDETLNIEWDDKSLDDIISIMVFNLDINENNPRYQLQTLRTQK